MILTTQELADLLTFPLVFSQILIVKLNYMASPLIFHKWSTGFEWVNLWNSVYDNLKTHTLKKDAILKINGNC